MICEICGKICNPTYINEKGKCKDCNGDDTKLVHQEFIAAGRE